MLSGAIVLKMIRTQGATVKAEYLHDIVLNDTGGRMRVRMSVFGHMCDLSMCMH